MWYHPDMSREVNIDIGGAEGSHFASLARRNRDALYIVLDPVSFRSPYTDIPNLRLIQWRSDKGWDLPFRGATVDRAELNNIYSVIYEVAPVAGTRPRVYQRAHYYAMQDEAIYGRLIASLKRVMKSTGTVHVRETRTNLDLCKELFQGNGFKIDGPRRTPREHWTGITHHFMERAKEEVEKNRVPLAETMFLPMEFTATLG